MFRLALALLFLWKSLKAGAATKIHWGRCFPRGFGRCAYGPRSWFKAFTILLSLLLVLVTVRKSYDFDVQISSFVVFSQPPSSSLLLGVRSWLPPTTRASSTMKQRVRTKAEGAKSTLKRASIIRSVQAFWFQKDQARQTQWFYVVSGCLIWTLKWKSLRTSPMFPCLACWDFEWILYIVGCSAAGRCST